MIPVVARLPLLTCLLAAAIAASADGAPPALAVPAVPGTAPGMPGLPAPSAVPADCLASGDGYLHARVRGTVDATIDWPNSGTQCQGESKSQPPGVRLSFQRAAGATPDMLFVFGLTGIRRGQPAHATGANLTVIVHGKNQIFGTLGDSRCTVDSLAQRALPAPGTYRIEARGFCTQPARALRGPGEVLVSTFEFAGLVNFGTEMEAAAAPSP